MAPWAKVVQTVVCSTFTHGAKPGARRVADGERMDRGGGAFAQISRDVEHQGDGHLENCPRGAPAPCPVRMASSAPLYHPLTSYADAAGSPVH